MDLRRIIWFVFALTLIPAFPRQATAHAIIISSVPATNATLDADTAAGPYILRFNSRVDRNRSRITLLTSDGSKFDLPIVTGFDADALKASGLTSDPGPSVLVATGPASALNPGAYRLRWHVLSVDGHITSGDIPFTVTGGKAAQPTANPTP